ncbi:MAG: transglycosylase SLT domain-containing protein [Rhodospirillales bacterium]|nr:transglycosylase SLT domain-containing protein [Rhodospirillales bacterium]
MNGLTNVIQNKDLTALTHKAPQQIVNAIAEASDHTGVNFAYLVQQAQAESNFNPQAKASTSTASGLYQFIERTWLAMIKEHGDEYGLGDLAEKIDSHYRVKDRQARQEILALRNDPVVSAQMAAEFAMENKQVLNKLWGGDVGPTELYLAHFLGSGAAASFLKARDENPLTPAADLFPRPARANRGVFYDPNTGKPRTLEQVYQFFDQKFQIKDGAPDPSTFAIAQNEPSAPNTTNSLYPQEHAAKPYAPSGRLYDFHEFTALHSKGAIVPPIPYQSANQQKGDSVFRGKQIPQQPFFSLMANPVDLMLLSQSDLNPAPQDAKEQGQGDKSRLNG